LNYWAEDDIASLYRHTVETEQMMARLLAEVRTNQTKADANLKDIKEELKKQPRKDASQDRGQ
jgi:hypothetical protein